LRHDGPIYAPADGALGVREQFLCQINMASQLTTLFQVASYVFNCESHEAGIYFRSVFRSHEKQIQSFLALVEDMHCQRSISCKPFSQKFRDVSHH